MTRAILQFGCIVVASAGCADHPILAPPPRAIGLESCTYQLFAPAADVPFFAGERLCSQPLVAESAHFETVGPVCVSAREWWRGASYRPTSDGECPSGLVGVGSSDVVLDGTELIDEVGLVWLTDDFAPWAWKTTVRLGDLEIEIDERLGDWDVLTGAFRVVDSGATVEDGPLAAVAQ
ncbi:MAG: hypothetical protein R3F61_00255 [Myxococcota bacterium]